MPVNQPNYAIHVVAEHCRHEVRVNDVPVIRSPEGHPTDVEIDLNIWVHNGVNSLTAELTPLPGEENLSPRASVSIELLEQQERGNGEETKTLERLRYREGKVSVDRLGAGRNQSTARARSPSSSRTTLTYGFPLRLPYGPWMWESAPKVTDSPAVRNSLAAELKALHELYRAGDATQILPALRMWLEDEATASYVPLEHVESNERETISHHLRPSGMKLQELILDGAQLRIYGEGRLATLTDEDDESLLFLADEDFDQVSLIDFLFYKDQKGTWRVCRVRP